MIVDVDPSAVRARRLTDARRRALAQDRGDLGAVTTIHVGAPHKQSDHADAVVMPFCDDLEQMRIALELGLSDYVRKNGFREIVVGVSGGIDSALVAGLAAEALGPDRVHCVSMPSRYSSEGTRGDAQRLAESLGCEFREIPIEPMVESVPRGARAALRRTRSRPHRGEPAGADPRHAAHGPPNKFGWLLVATGNKV